MFPEHPLSSLNHPRFDSFFTIDYSISDFPFNLVIISITERFSHHRVKDLIQFILATFSISYFLLF